MWVPLEVHNLWSHTFSHMPSKCVETHMSSSGVAQCQGTQIRVYTIASEESQGRCKQHLHMTLTQKCFCECRYTRDRPEIIWSLAANICACPLYHARLSSSRSLNNTCHMACRTGNHIFRVFFAMLLSRRPVFPFLKVYTYRGSVACMREDKLGYGAPRPLV